MLIYLKSIKHNVCLVSIDFAGLTRTHDIIQLIETIVAVSIPDRCFNSQMFTRWLPDEYQMNTVTYKLLAEF